MGAVKIAEALPNTTLTYLERVSLALVPLSCLCDVFVAGVVWLA